MSPSEDSSEEESSSLEESALAASPGSRHMPRALPSLSRGWRSRENFLPPVRDVSKGSSGEVELIYLLAWPC